MVVFGDKCLFVVGYYLPFSDKGATQRLVTAALDRAPVGSFLLIVGDLNSNLDFPQDGHEEILRNAVRERSIRCALRLYLLLPLKATEDKGEIDVASKAGHR